MDKTLLQHKISNHISKILPKTLNYKNIQNHRFQYIQVYNMSSPKMRFKPQKAQLSVSIGSSVKELVIFCWLKVSELKQEIHKITGIPVSDQRLFNGHVELSNNRSLDDYSLFDKSRKNKHLVLEAKCFSGSFIRIIPGALCSKLLQDTIHEVNQGLKLNFAPNLSWDGTGGTYFMKDPHRNVRGVFKPIDEEAYAPMNPRGYQGTLNNPGIRSGILSGESAYREVAAYLLDHGNFSGVPATALVESQHNHYNYNLNEPASAKKGSFQRFIVNKGSIEDFSPAMFDKFEIQKIAILDMRILNMDRNEGNILVDNQKKLIPIDHGLSIPDCFDISEYDLCWMNWQQCKDSIDEMCLDFINSIDPVKDITFLNEILPFRDKCLRNIRISTLLLKKGANSGLSLSQIGSIMYRDGYEQNPSIIEQVIKKSLGLYKTINKSLSTRLKLEKCLSKKGTSRSRAHSSNEIDYLHFGDTTAKTQCSTPGEIECAFEIKMTISEEKEESDEDEDLHIDEYSGRSLSLPCFAKLNSKSKKNKHEAFDKKLFYYMESFIELAVQQKVKDILSKIYLEFTNPNGRVRSVSDVRDHDDFNDYDLY